MTECVDVGTVIPSPSYLFRGKSGKGKKCWPETYHRAREHFDCLQLKALQDGLQRALDHLEAVRSLLLYPSQSLEYKRRWQHLHLCPRLFPRLCERHLHELRTCITECLALRRCNIRDGTPREYLESECDEVLLRGRHECG